MINIFICQISAMEQMHLRQRKDITIYIHMMEKKQVESIRREQTAGHSIREMMIMR